MKTSQKFVRRLRERFPMIDPPSSTSNVTTDLEPVVASLAKPPVTKRAARKFILRLRERFPMIDPPRVDAEPIKDQLSRHMRERFPKADAATLAPAGTDGSVSSPEEVGKRGWRIIFTPIPMFRGGGAKGRAARALHGGRVRDFGRLPRYSMIFFFGAMAIWTPVALYLKFAPVRYTSELSLILPGAGVSTSVNLSDIGQASTSANSPYSSPSLSPTVLYKNLLESYSVISRAADMMNMTAPTFGKPVVKLVDETSLIHVSLVGKTPEDAHDRAEAMHQALLTELDKLRDDEIKRREVASIDTIKNYQETVDAVRAKISALQLSSGLNSADQYSGIVTAAETLQIRVAESQTALREKESAVRSLSETLRVSPEIAAATLKAHADPTLGSLSSTSAKDAADLAELERAYGPKHPKYLNVLSRASSVRARLESRGAAVTGLSEADFRDKIDMNPSGERVVLLARLVTLVMERDGLVSQLKAQSEELAKDRERVRALVDVASKLDTLNRDYKVADAVFASALARINTSKTDIFASYPMLQVAEPPTMPEKASSPNKIIAAAAGAGGTLFLLVGLGLAWVRRPLIDRILAKGGAPHEAA